MRILIATDAWKPQVNGVVRTYENLKRELEAAGHFVTILSPLDFATLPCPGYREIRLALARRSQVAALLKRGAYDHVHIATEGPIGWATRGVCLRQRIRFTTSFHTRFPEYIEAYTGLPAWISYAFQRWFHRPGIGMFVATRSLKAELSERGFRRLMLWSRGVDTVQFKPRPRSSEERVEEKGEPTFLYVGRVSREKNVEAFLNLDLPGRKVVVGDGPILGLLRRQYPNVIFTGAKTGEDLAQEYSNADVFVFPSRTDTFGLVLLEAMASGLGVAAYPVTGPIDVVTPGVTGCLDEDLRAAALAALKLDRDQVRVQAMRHDWSRVADLFLANITQARRAAGLGKRLIKARVAKSLQIKPRATVRPVS
ncbi:glycosyltransferase family 4 protein [Hyphomicrobium sp.]|jgi:glycosyltransferase involved in cell wall biosynthesis|uniref:glycosyltransferase family 4 protein n=1 Tax=Hyphomicrobium sp. TaxID=82 RepID=UPI00356546CE